MTSLGWTIVLAALVLVYKFAPLAAWRLDVALAALVAVLGDRLRRAGLTVDGRAGPRTSFATPIFTPDASRMAAGVILRKTADPRFS